jgi:hypothetical protein
MINDWRRGNGTVDESSEAAGAAPKSTKANPVLDLFSLLLVEVEVHVAASVTAAGAVVKVNPWIGPHRCRCRAKAKPWIGPHRGKFLVHSPGKIVGGGRSSCWCRRCRCRPKTKVKPWIGPHRLDVVLVHGQCSSQWVTTVVTTIAVADAVTVAVTVADANTDTTSSRLLLLASKNPNLCCCICC